MKYFITALVFGTRPSPQVSSAMSAAKAMTAGSFLTSSAAAAGPSDDASAGNDGAGQDEQDSTTPNGRNATAALATRLSRTALSLKSLRRPSVRTPDTADDVADDPHKGSPKTSPEADDRSTVPRQPGGGTSEEVGDAAEWQRSPRAVVAPESDSGAGRHEQTSLFEGGSSSSHASRTFADKGTADQAEPLPSQSPPVSRPSQNSAGSSDCGAAPATESSSIPTVGLNTSSSSASSGARSGRRAFAGGLWNGNSGSQQAPTAGSSVADTTPDGEQLPSMVSSTAAHDAEASAPEPKPSSSSKGSRRKFAGGLFGGAESSSSAGGGRSDNPFGAGGGEESAPSRDAVASLVGESRDIPLNGGAGVQSTPSWAVSDSADDVPDWARDAGDVATSTTSVGLAPPSR